MIFTQPVFLVLLIPLAAVYYMFCPARRTLKILRAAILLLVLLAIAGLALKLKSRHGVIVVVADRSKSMPVGSDSRIKEIIDIIQKDGQGKNKLAVVSFGADAMIDHAPQSGTFGGFAGNVNHDASNLSGALDLAMACVPGNAPGRILLLSDGKYTGIDPLNAATKCAMRSIPVDYRLLERPGTQDTAIYQIDTPSQVSAGEAFFINTWVQSPLSQEIKFELRRNSKVLADGVRKIDAGLTRLSFRDLLDNASIASYTISIIPTVPDSLPENNTARVLVGVYGRRKVLCVSDNGQELSRMLNENRIEHELDKPTSVFWNIDELSKYSAVILDNVPANKIGNVGMETLAQWVNQTGSGLMFTGGKQSYGQGGYFKSPLEEIMPVSMELRQEHRKFATAIVVVMDRSGSMAVSVGTKTKMDLANLATVQVLDLLSDMDEFGVIAVDSMAHTVVPIGAVSTVDSRRSEVLSVQSMGGGIFIYEALSAAAKMVAQSQSQNRHIILFADAADSEEPGDYKNLLSQCAQAGITVSVIGLGNASDVDAKLLEEIASLGKGQIYFTEDAMELPRLFAQDTFVTARNTFIEEETYVESTPGLLGITGTMFHISEPVGGYNLCYLRPGATLGVHTIDDNKAPIVAAWQAGAGRVLCFTIPTATASTGPIASWGGYSPFIGSLARWTAGQDGASNQDYVFTQQVENGVYRLKMHLDPDRTKQINALPQVNVLRGIASQKPSSEKYTLLFKDAQTMELEIPLKGSETLLASVKLSETATCQLTPVCLPYSPEFAPAQAGSGEEVLKKIARITDGKQRVDLGRIWAELPKKTQIFPIAPWLLLSAIILLLLEVLERRTGIVSSQTFNLPSFKNVRVKLKNKPAKAIKSQPSAVAENMPTMKSEAELVKQEKLESSLSAARKRADQFLKKQ